MRSLIDIRLIRPCSLLDRIDPSVGLRRATVRKHNLHVLDTALAIVRDDTGRILLIRRAKPPEEGRWTLPGGRVEAGETSEEAAAREVLEETGLSIQVVKRLDVFRIPVRNGDDYEVHNLGELSSRRPGRG